MRDCRVSICLQPHDLALYTKGKKSRFSRWNNTAGNTLIYIRRHVKHCFQEDSIKRSTHLSKFLSTCSFSLKGSFNRLPPVCLTKYDGKLKSALVSSTALEYSLGYLSAANMSMSCRSTTMQSKRQMWSSASAQEITH